MCYAYVLHGYVLHVWICVIMHGPPAPRGERKGSGQVQMWDVGCGMWDAGCGMWDVGCGM